MAAEQNIDAERAANYSPEDRAFFDFWYGHMVGDMMQAPLAGVTHSTARYIWDAARRSAAIGEGGLVGDLSMLVRQLVHSLKKAKPDSDLAARAVDYLQRKGLAGSPLRGAAPPLSSEQQAKGESDEL
jgi:hypothetical protein